MIPRMHLRLCLGALWLAIACRQSTPSADQQPEPATTENPAPALGDSLRAAVQAEVKEPSCRNGAECRSAGYGSKPCGGPRSYLIYSTMTTDSARLASALERYNGWDAARNRQGGAVSNCMFEAPPALTCSEGRCSRAP
jgi:hypothetical protein